MTDVPRELPSCAQAKISSPKGKAGAREMPFIRVNPDRKSREIPTVTEAELIRLSAISSDVAGRTLYPNYFSTNQALDTSLTGDAARQTFCMSMLPIDYQLLHEYLPDHVPESSSRLSVKDAQRLVDELNKDAQAKASDGKTSFVYRLPTVEEMQIALKEAEVCDVHATLRESLAKNDPRKISDQKVKECWEKEQSNIGLEGRTIMPHGLWSLTSTPVGAKLKPGVKMDESERAQHIKIGGEYKTQDLTELLPTYFASNYSPDIRSPNTGFYLVAEERTK